MESKSASHSLTLWFNGVIGAVAVAMPQIESMLPVLSAVLPATINPYLVLVMAIGNALIRFRTSKPVTLFGKSFGV